MVKMIITIDGTLDDPTDLDSVILPDVYADVDGINESGKGCLTVRLDRE